MVLRTAEEFFVKLYAPPNPDMIQRRRRLAGRAINKFNEVNDENKK